MHKLDQIISEKHLLNTTFYQKWMDGTLAMEDLQAYAKAYRPHVDAFPRYVSAVHSKCTNDTTRKALLDNLIEEEHGEENHPELWLRFAEGLGLNRNAVKKAQASVAGQKLVDTFEGLTQKSFASGIGALYAYESQVPDVAKLKIEGLEKNYGITDDRTLEFFRVHQEADVWHSGSEREAYDRMNDEEKAEAEEATRKATSALWDFLESLV